MHSRMVHLGQEGRQMSQSYSIHGEHINAVDRARLNELLLDAAEEWSNVTIHFEHKLKKLDVEKGTMVYLVGADEFEVTKQADFIVGADGAYSKVRDQMMRKIRMNFQQEYIDTGYCELYMPPKIENGKPTYALDPNHLHIWPRHTFMLIALPNPDKSFTCTLFMPFDMFESIKTDGDLMKFFRTNFNDAIPLIGEERLKDDYRHNTRGSLISIKTSPHHIKDKIVIVGDAAHAMVPFYGQGMNCGFQDTEVLHQVLDKHHVRPVLSRDGSHIPGLMEALSSYSEERVKDAHAICDLAMYNHYEMRSAVTSVRYLARKKLEGWIQRVMPQWVTPLYSMVSFSTLPYSQAIHRWHRQNFWLNVALGSVTMTITGVSAWMLWRMVKSPSNARQSLPSPTSSVNVASLVNSAASSTAGVVNATVSSATAAGAYVGSSLGINGKTLNQAQDKVKSAAGYVSQWLWK
ncbi:uncharacterized protein BX664DRAFT_282504 [Halteromyces radiatus]|uniref:uncharacterized protein n=1 Tax=Halteromyces radiatus TaxID=101107 RepID=UPI0022208037|nr:uncharacterized protein BX664DRAFT_282504 [Halteromyces radiatus]KAI8086515.1 hypothetical protein BX664DRAFT_282504 [Halteromyces radiatus]